MKKVLITLCLVILFSLTAFPGGSGFDIENSYVNYKGEQAGYRLVHYSGTVVDVIFMNTVPQAFIWFNTLPVSDGGHPHILEHVVLSKGNVAKTMNEYEERVFGFSSAFTKQFRTCYGLSTTAGNMMFRELLKRKLYSLINPDYSDEEIRREVMNIGVGRDSEGRLFPEEKGTIYAEMNSAFEKENQIAYYEIEKLLFGDDDVRGCSSGGFPAAIRDVTPEEVIDFHDRNYRTEHMGMVLVMPPGDSPEEVRDYLNELFDYAGASVNPAEAGPEEQIYRLRDGGAAGEGRFKVVSFPAQDEDKPGTFIAAWKIKGLDPYERLLLDYFVRGLSQGRSSLLWKRFVDEEERVIKEKAADEYLWLEDYTDTLYFGLKGVEKAQDHSGEAAEFLKTVKDILDEVASYEGGSEELLAFNELVLLTMDEDREYMKLFLESPPRFGYRSTGSYWMEYLKQLDGFGGDVRDLNMTAIMDDIRARVTVPGNPWSALIDKWEIVPERAAAVRTVPDSAYFDKADEYKAARLEKALEEIKAAYKTKDGQKALSLYMADCDEAEREIIERESEIEHPEFTPLPPMTQDDILDYEESRTEGFSRVFRGYFDNMNTVTASIYFDLNGVEEDELIYLSLLPEILTSSGAVKDGRRYSSLEVEKILRREIADFDVSMSGSMTTGRNELKISISALGEDFERAFDALSLIYRHIDLGKGSASEISETAARSFKALLNITQGREESWVGDPFNALFAAGDPVYLASRSGFTRQFNALRLKWRFMDTGEKKAFKRSALGVIDALKARGVDALDDVQGPAAGLAQDLKSITGLMPPEKRDELAVKAAGILADEAMYGKKAACREIESFVKKVMKKTPRRAVFTGSRVNIAAAERLAAKDLAQSGALKKSGKPASSARLSSVTEEGRMFALINNETNVGVIQSRNYGAEFDEDDMYGYIASGLLGGSGADGLFMKTWRSGLAYSNGVGSDMAYGYVSYYAERCPDVVMTLKFVTDTLNQTPDSERMAKNALMNFFWSRSGNDFSSRSESMAIEVMEGRTAEKYREMRTKLLYALSDPEMPAKVYGEKNRLLSAVIPGLDGPMGREAILMFITNDEQAGNIEKYLSETDETGGLIKIYPSDFWMGL